MSALAGMSTDGLSTDQAPPLSIPMSFFLTAPLAMVAAGVLLFTQSSAFLARHLAATVGLTHLGTLGLLGAVMLGALYQMIPVVAGAPVPLIRLAHAVHAGLVVGFATLVWALVAGSPTGLIVAAAILGGVLLAFLVPTIVALLRAPTRHDTVTGLRLAVVGLLVVGAIGVTLALARAGISVPGAAATWLAAHIAIGLLGWVGALIVSVSWQVLPMFYLAPELPRWSRLLTLVTLALALVGAPVAALIGGPPLWALAAVTPLALMLWLVHPLLVALALRARRRKRADGSIRFWWAGIACAPLLLPLAAMANFGSDPRWALAFGWLALFGWAGLIVHGMLTRIVAFLIWFHRFAPLVGRVPTPSMRQIYPDLLIKFELGLHLSTLGFGLLTIAMPEMLALPYLTALCLILTGLVLLIALWRALSHAAPKNVPAAPALEDMMAWRPTTTVAKS